MEQAGADTEVDSFVATILARRFASSSLAITAQDGSLLASSAMHCAAAVIFVTTAIQLQHGQVPA